MWEGRNKPCLVCLCLPPPSFPLYVCMYLHLPATYLVVTRSRLEGALEATGYIPVLSFFYPSRSNALFFNFSLFQAQGHSLAHLEIPTFRYHFTVNCFNSSDTSLNSNFRSDQSRTWLHSLQPCLLEYFTQS